MFKMRTAILGSAAALAIALPAGAQNYGYNNGYDSYGYGQSGYQNAYDDCETQRRSRQQTAGIVGAIAGGVLGAAIADDDDDNRYRNRGYRGYDRYGRYHRGNRHYRGHHRDNDSGDQIAGALIGAVVGGVAGSALAGSGDDCNRQAYGTQPNPRYGNANVAPPTRQAYGHQDYYDRNDYQRTYSRDELYGGENDYYRTGGTTYSTSPSYGATTSGYNAGYTSGYDSGECRTVYQGNVERTACNVGGDRWEFEN